MRILIVSDLHANLEAVRVLPEDYDELWVLGDLVNYGPNPCEVVDWVRTNAALVVRGNHDHAIGYGEDPQCSRRFRRMAEETGRFTRSVLSDAQREFLRGLPLTAERGRFRACHAAPGNPLHEYRPPDSPLWDDEAAEGTLLVGHTHLPFRRGAVVNPGSVGQPKHGVPRACYAIWEDDDLRLESAEYDAARTVAKIGSLPLSPEVKGDLELVLRTGSASGLAPLLPEAA